MASIVGRYRGFLNKSSKPGHINNKTKFYLAFPSMPVTLSNVLIHNAYIKYYTDMVSLDVRYVGIIYFIFGIWNAINDPMLGIWIDRFKFTKQRGKYVYIMRRTAPVTLLAAGAMVFAQPSWEQWVIFAFLLILLFIFDTTQTAYSIALAAYTFVAAPTNEERVGVSVVGQYVGHIGGFFGTVIPTLLLVGETDRQLTVILFSAVLILNALLYFLALRPLKDTAEMYKDDFESEEGQFANQLKINAKDALTSRAFVTYILYQFFARGPKAFYFTPFLFMMDHVLRLSGDQALVVDVIPGLMLFLAAPFLGRFSKRVGLKKAAMYGAVPTALGFLALYVVQDMWQALLAYIVIIVFSAISAIIHVPMLGAIVDEDEQRTNERKAGLYTGLNALLTIPVTGAQTVIFTSILAAFTFVSGAETQNDLAIQGIRVGASIVPFISILIGVVPMYFSNITREKERELSAFSEQMRRGLRDDLVETSA